MNQSDIQLRLYRTILTVAAGLSVMSIVGNSISGFPSLANLKWAVLFAITVVAVILSYKKKFASHAMFVVFMLLTCVFLPFGFLDSGGSSNNATAYVFLLLIALTYLFNGWTRYFLFGMVTSVLMIMHTVEYYHPEMVAVYPRRTLFIDQMLQIPLIFAAGFLILLKFAKDYERINKKLTQYANIDELTGLYNRRMLNRAMEEAVQKMNEPIYLALLDLDNYKKINDTYGHSFGDQVLQKLAFTLQDTFGQEKHIVCRWGGDEFAIIFYGEQNTLINRLNKAKKVFTDYISAYESSGGISTSIISFSDYDTASKALIEADRMLYTEKQMKRGRD